MLVCAHSRRKNLRNIRICNGWKAVIDSAGRSGIPFIGYFAHSHHEREHTIFIIQKIASEIDKSVPGGANWHRELLDQMVLEINGIRPAVLSTETKEKLEDYRGLRHVVRNVYTFRLNPEKLAVLVKNLPDVMSKLELELTGFSMFLQGV